MNPFTEGETWESPTSTVGKWGEEVKGGIADVVNEIQNLIADKPVDGVAVGWGVVKIIFSGFLGSVTFYALFFPGYTMTLGGFKRKRR